MPGQQPQQAPQQYNAPQQQQPYQAQPQQAPQQQYNAQTQQQPYNPYQQPYQQKKSSKWVLWLILGLLGLAIAGFAAWFFLVDNDLNPWQKKEATTTTTTQVDKTDKDKASVKTKPAAKDDDDDEFDDDDFDNTDDIDIDDDNNSKAAGEKETVYVDREVVVEKEVPVPVATPTPAPAPRKNYGGGANYNVGSWPETSQRYLDPSELYGMSAWEKKIMRNEIYARHGYIFQTRDMIEYFNAQPWYTPRTRNVRLSEIETYNVQLIKSVE